MRTVVYERRLGALLVAIGGSVVSAVGLLTFAPTGGLVWLFGLALALAGVVLGSVLALVLYRPAPSLILESERVTLPMFRGFLSHEIRVLKFAEVTHVCVEQETHLVMHCGTRSRHEFDLRRLPTDWSADDLLRELHPLLFQCWSASRSGRAAMPTGSEP
jgi:hypothetical protein